MTIRDAQLALASRLAPAVGQGEAKAMASAIVEDVKGYKPIDVVLYGQRELLPETVDRMMAIAQKVVDGMPLQYAIGRAQFRGRYFAVSPATLIPRPETAQLVDMIAKQWAAKSDLRVLDIGTGTGCIAISLALDLPFAMVDAIDISPDALDVAKANAKDLKAKVRFIQADALRLPAHRAAYDIIVSNPPYVLESERVGMDARVALHEPGIALFVPDSDPLRFYEPIATYASKALKPGGMLYFEINPLCAKQIQAMLKRLGFYQVDIMSDYRGQLRFAVAKA